MLLVFATQCFGQIDERENAALESWLIERNLDALLLEQLESRLESTISAASREQVAKRLATLYGKRLLSPDADPQQLLKRTRELIELYPRFETGKLRVAMLHARYLESENLFRDWIRGGAKADARQKLDTTLKVLDEDLAGALTALMRESEELFAAGQLSRDRRPLESQRQAVEAEALHCQFLAGWSSYFLAMIREKDRSVLLDQSELRFREFLQLDQQTLLSDYDSRWFDFSSAWHVRALAGLAAVATAVGDETQADHCYKLIESNAVTQDSREAVIRFRFLADCYCGKYDDATNVVRDRKAIAAMSRTGRIRLWATVIETQKASQSEALKTLALVGLTRNSAGELLVREIEKAAGPSGENTFDSCWVSGYAKFWKSENGDPDLADKAGELLLKAVSLGENPKGETDRPADANDVARCRYLLAWLLLKQNKTENAIGMFSQVADQLAEADAQLASESAWLAAKNSVRMSGRDPGRINDSWNRLERFVRTWPDSPHASKAGFEKLKIELRSMQPVDAIRRLKEISTVDENRGDSLLEIAAQNYRLWQSQPEDATTLENFRKACNDVSSSGSTTPGQKLRANFLLLDAAIRTETDSPDVFDALVQRCNQLLEQIDDSDLAKAELQYYQMQFFRRAGDVASAYRAAEQVVLAGEGVGEGTRFELPALIQMAEYRDSMLNNSDDINTAVEIYIRLSQRLGRSAEQLKASANARVALSRLGELQQLAGQSAKSEQIFQTLVDNFEGNAQYLRNLAIAKSQRDPQGARELWQRLASGSEAGSDLWFESKLEFAKQIANQDRDSALKLLKQTMQLGGEMPEVWEQAYESKIEQLSQDGGR